MKSVHLRFHGGEEIQEMQRHLRQFSDDALDQCVVGKNYRLFRYQ